MYDDVTLCILMWHCVWWCDTVYDDVTPCVMMWHDACVFSNGIIPPLLIDARLVSVMMWHHVWWCDNTYDAVTLCMMMSHCIWWCHTSSCSNLSCDELMWRWVSRWYVPYNVCDEERSFYWTQRLNWDWVQPTLILRWVSRWYVSYNVCDDVCRWTYDKVIFKIICAI